MKFVYDKAREKFLGGDLDWDGHDIKVIAVKAAYTPNQATHEFVSSIGAANIIVRSPLLASKSKTAGVADAADSSLSSVPASETIAALVIARDTGDDATSPLIAYTDEATNLPLLTSGANISLGFSNAAERIFKL